MGGFAIGTTEFVTMGLLPDIAKGIDESIPNTGHIISAYAFGVVVGAPLIVSFGARLPQRSLAIGLMLAIGIGNGITALAQGYLPVLLARFVAGLPHGAYFGVASLLAASMVEPRFRGRAVSSVMLGLAVANVAGVPASTWLGQNLGWRSAYWTVVGLTVLTAIAIRFLVPKVEGDKSASVGRELNALRQPQVLFTVAAGMVGFGGMFAMYSYIAPTVTDVTGLSRSAIPWFLFAFGLGGLAGTAIGGRLADFSVIKSLVGGFLGMAVLLALFVVGAGYAVAALFLVFAISAAGSLVAVCLQMRLMDVAGEAKMLGAALNHSALNLANGLGAYLGAVVISAGYGYTAPSKVGVGLALGGLAILGVSIVHAKRTRTRELVSVSV